MSFVSVVSRETFITVMSDTREISLTGEILSEETKKSKKIGERHFVAYAGIRIICETVADGIEHLLLAGADFKLIYDKLSPLIQGKVPDPHTAMFSFGGINNEGEMEVITFSSTNNDVNIQKPKGKAISYAFLSGHYKNGIDYNEKFQEFIKVFGDETPTDFLHSQKALNKLVSENDNSVNNKTDRFVIKKTDA
ncbi:hypothetical protein D3C72_245080 [compost metagenome]